MAISFQSTCSPVTIGCILEDGYGGFVPDGYYSDGLNWYLVTGGSGEVTSSGSCTTTTTTEPPPTTTTTTLAYNSFLLAYSGSTGGDACSNYPTLFTNTYFTDPAFNYLANGVTIYQDSSLTSPAGDGFYSDGTHHWETNSFSGNLQNQTLCPGVTTSTTTTSTTTTTTTSTTTTTTAYPYGDFELDPAYGINITSLTASSGTLPAFTFPRNSGSGQTLDMVSSYTISTVFTVGISGTRQFGTNKTITLYVNSVAKACQVITSDGPQTKSLTSSVAILDTDNVTIAIDNAPSC